MGIWKEGVYHANYILNQKGMVAQTKFECDASPGRLDEVSLERYEDGEMRLLFTTHPDVSNDAKQGGVHARLAYNSLIEDINRFNRKHARVTYTVSNDEVHCMAVANGHERFLHQLLNRLEEFDHTLSEVRKQLDKAILANQATVDEINQAISNQQDRLKLLGQVKEQELGGKKPTKRRTTTKKKTTMRRKTAAKGRGRRRA